MDFNYHRVQSLNEDTFMVADTWTFKLYVEERNLRIKEHSLSSSWYLILHILPAFVHECFKTYWCTAYSRLFRYTTQKSGFTVMNILFWMKLAVLRQWIYPKNNTRVIETMNLKKEDKMKETYHHHYSKIPIYEEK